MLMKNLIISFLGGVVRLFGLAEIANQKEGPERLNPQLRRHIDLVDYLENSNIAKNSNILDVGCGVGLLAKRLRERGYNNIDGTDWLARENVNFINEFSSYTQVDLNNESFSQTNFSKQYDIIIASDVIEHLESPARFFRLVKPLLKSDGHLIITIPNAFNILQRIYILLTANSTRYNVEKKGEYGHINIFTRNTLTSLLNRTGMEIKNVSGGGAFLSNLCILPKYKCGPWLSYNLLYEIKLKN